MNEQMIERGEYAKGLDAGFDVALNSLNEALKTDFKELGDAIHHVWKLRMGFLPKASVQSKGDPA